jgi:4-aminobutyrate aminotransferase-like enzyme
MAAGLNLSAVTGHAKLMDAPAPGGLGGTYAGNPLAIAAAHAVIDIMQNEQLPTRGQLLGDQLQAHLRALQPRVPAIAQVRGLGAMVAAEFRHPDGTPNAAFTKAVQAYALSHGLILLTCGMDANVLRFLFPLTIAHAHFQEALGILEAALLNAVTVAA